MTLFDIPTMVNRIEERIETATAIGIGDIDITKYGKLLGHLREVIVLEIEDAERGLGLYDLGKLRGALDAVDGLIGRLCDLIANVP